MGNASPTAMRASPPYEIGYPFWAGDLQENQITPDLETPRCAVMRLPYATPNDAINVSLWGFRMRKEIHKDGHCLKFLYKGTTSVELLRNYEVSVFTTHSWTLKVPV